MPSENIPPVDEYDPRQQHGQDPYGHDGRPIHKEQGRDTYGRDPRAHPHQRDMDPNYQNSFQRNGQGHNHPGYAGPPPRDDFRDYRDAAEYGRAPPSSAQPGANSGSLPRGVNRDPNMPPTHIDIQHPPMSPSNTMQQRSPTSGEFPPYATVNIPPQKQHQQQFPNGANTNQGNMGSMQRQNTKERAHNEQIERERNDQAMGQKMAQMQAQYDRVSYRKEQLFKSI